MTVEAGLLGYTIGLVDHFVPNALPRVPKTIKEASKAPGNLMYIAGGYAGFTAAKGGSREDMIDAAVTVLGFKAFYAIHQSHGKRVGRAKYRKAAIGFIREHNRHLQSLSDTEIGKMIDKLKLTQKDTYAVVHGRKYKIPEELISKGSKGVGIEPYEIRAEPRFTTGTQPQAKRMASQPQVPGQERVFVSKEGVPINVPTGTPKTPSGVVPPPVSKGRRVIVPQRTAIEKSKFPEFATEFTATRSRELGVPLIPTDPRVLPWRLRTLKELHKTQQRSYRRYQRKLKHKERPNRLSVLTPSRHAIMSLGEKLGIPLHHDADAAMKRGWSARSDTFTKFSSTIRTDHIAKLTKKDNSDIGAWLYNSPETRGKVERTMSGNALMVAHKLHDLFQGPIKAEAQHMIARRWDRAGIPPSDVWNYPTAVIANKWSTGQATANGLSKTILYMFKNNLHGTSAKVKNKIDKIAKSSDWNANDKSLVNKVLKSSAVNAEIDAMRTYPDNLLAKVRDAKSKGKLAEHIRTEAAWAKGDLGTRKYYYMSEFGKKDTIDFYNTQMAIGALEGYREAPAMMPGTETYEAHARTSKFSVPKSGSVITNALRHWQKMAVANAVDDPLSSFYNKINEKIIDPQTGKKVFRHKLSDQDKTNLGRFFGNLLMKHETPVAPWSWMIDVKRWSWRTRLSWAARPDAVFRLSFRNALQNPAMAPTAVNVREMTKEAARMSWWVSRGKKFKDYDPEMTRRNEKNFPSQVSQRNAIFREFLLQDTAAMSQKYSRPLVQWYAAALERTGGVYGGVDELSRRTLWSGQYQVIKRAAIQFKRGKITEKQFLARTGLGETRIEQRLMCQDLLSANRIDDLAEYGTGITVEDVHHRYSTEGRQAISQTQPQRLATGLITFPEGAIELVIRRGILAMVHGAETKNWSMVRRGLNNTLKNIAFGELAAYGLIAVTGKSAYDAAARFRYEMLGPGMGTVADMFAKMTATMVRIGQGTQWPKSYWAKRLIGRK
jgi:hypothetical protein